MSKKRRRTGDTGRMKKADRYEKRSQRNRIGNTFVVLQAALSIIFMTVLVLLNMLPTNYLIIVGVFLFFLWTLTLNTQVARRKKGTIGKIVSFVIIFCLVVGSYYIAKTNNMISQIANGGLNTGRCHPEPGTALPEGSTITGWRQVFPEFPDFLNEQPI